MHHVGAIDDLSGARTIRLEEAQEPATSVGADLTGILRVVIGHGAQPSDEAERIVGMFLPPVAHAHRMPALGRFCERCRRALCARRYVHAQSSRTLEARASGCESP